MRRLRCANGLAKAYPHLRWSGTSEDGTPNPFRDYRLTVEFIDVAWDDANATLEVTLKYRPAGSPDSRVIKFQRSSR